MFKDENSEKIIARLGEKGFAAYYVGGCVRDGIMERDIHDIDIAAASLPDETMQVFKGKTIIPTGLKHGTVTVGARRQSVRDHDLPRRRHIFRQPSPRER